MQIITVTIYLQHEFYSYLKEDVADEDTEEYEIPADKKLFWYLQYIIFFFWC